MGQRHQAFLIARLVPHGEQTKAHYRCIAAIHHQWCYGRVPLGGTRRFLALVKNPDNAAILLDEIRRAQGKYGRQGEEPDVPETAFPYAQMLLTLAFFLDVDDPHGPYASGGGIERSFVDPNMGLFDHDNDDGMTIFDITDPLKPTYGHSKPGGGYILNAKTYVRSYYPMGPANDSTEIDIRCHIDVMKNDPVIKAELVAEVWPEFLQGESLNELLEQLEGNVPATTLSRLVSLTDLVHNRVVEEYAADTSTETRSDLPAEPNSVAALLLQPSENGLHTTLARVLQHELESNSGILDLSAPRCTLSPDAIRAIIPLLPSDAVKAVNFSGMRILTMQVIIDILEAFTDLIRLTLLDTNISNEQIMHLLSTQPKLFYHLHNLIHPALLVRQAPSPSPSPSPQSITIIQTDRSGFYRQGPCISSIPFFHPEKLVQGLTKYLGGLRIDSESKSFPETYIDGQLGPIMALSHGMSLKAPHALPPGFPDDSDDRLRWMQRTLSAVPIRGTYGKLGEEGWVFVLDYITMFQLVMSRYGSGIESESDGVSCYGFLKVETKVKAREEVSTESTEADNGTDIAGNLSAMTLSSNTVVKIYDIREFADAVEKEGRPRPSEEAIKAFEEAIGTKECVPWAGASRKMTVEEVKELGVFDSA